MQAPRLRRGLFGYTGRSVRLSLAVLEHDVAAASERARALASRGTQLEAELEGLRSQSALEISNLGAELDTAVASAAEARATLSRREELLDELRFELGSSRRLFLRQVGRTRSLEAALEDLAAELWQTRADLANARGASSGDGTPGPVVVLPDLEAPGPVSTNGHAQPEVERV